MATVIFVHFGASALAVVLRTQSRPFLRCVARCSACVQRFLCCREALPKERSGGGLKWYWFHLACQVAFGVREFLLISQLRAWTWELVFVNAAVWLTIAIVTREVWCFSMVREGPEERKVAVDGLLDMLLLPVNIIFFCAVCVRVLKLQPDTQMGRMVPVIIESGDIYEAFALWSVLVLFVKVVQAEMAGSHSNAMSSFRSFKSIALQGVKAWVFIQSAAVVLKLILQGLVAVYVPTFCYWASKTCTSCEKWYEDNVATALSAVTFLLCSFAIMFVFYFESGYRHHLEKTEPMWKFLGVKGIVSVTYFQWLVISALASPLHWSTTQVYLLHCLLYAFWMPLLATVHTFLAYPFYRFRSAEPELSPWLVAWLRTMDEAPAAPSDAAETPATPSVISSDSRMETLLDYQPSPFEARTVRLPEVSAPVSLAKLGFYAFLGILASCASSKALLTMIPPQQQTPGPLRNISCAGQGDVAHFLQSRADLHFALLNHTAETWSSPGVAGAWLPLCAETQLGCAPGHFAGPSKPPQLGCSAQGVYTWQGSCSAISCGDPPRLPHASPRMHDIERQNWTYGVTIHYDCDKPGYRGDLQAVCNVTGTWVVSGACVEVTCGAPPEILHAAPLWDPGRGNVSTGMVVRYQCEEMYNGTPTASCGDDGMYMAAGRCRRECGAPPLVPHAAPRYNNSQVESGWFVGMSCPYVCDPGYHGYVTAVCGEAGNYTVSGACVPVSCSSPPRLPQATARMEDLRRQNFSLGSQVHYDCNAPRFQGRLLAECLASSRWNISGACTQVTCGEPPALPHAAALRENATAGTVVRYQCDQQYNGTPSATCGYDGHYVSSGRCRRLCGPPPTVPQASPKAAAGSAEGWLAGMGVDYACDPGLEGGITAMCTDAGNFSVEGSCRPASMLETNSLRRKLTGVSVGMGVENLFLLGGLGLFCYQRYRVVAQPTAAGNELAEGSAPICPESSGA